VGGVRGRGHKAVGLDRGTISAQAWACVGAWGSIGARVGGQPLPVPIKRTTTEVYGYYTVDSTSGGTLCRILPSACDLPSARAKVHSIAAAASLGRRLTYDTRRNGSLGTTSVVYARTSL
jgi:hypothetical protein